MKRLKVYVGCSLTFATDEFRQSVEDLKDALRDVAEVFDFLGLVKGTPTDVYNYDIHEHVDGCDYFIAVCDYPSTGLGYELGTAVEKWRKPVLAVAHKNAKVTRLVLGINAPNFKFVRYNNMSEVIELARRDIETLSKQEVQA